MSLLLLLFFSTFGYNEINAYEIGDCGIRYNNSIAHDDSSKNNEFPWHAALFRMNNSSKYEYICGASIIYTNVVVTAAHCVYDEAEQDIDYSRMVIAVGKKNSSWEHREVHEQRLEVISKKVPPFYRGIHNMNQDDIALLVLNDTIKFSNIAMPVCIDWKNLYEPHEAEVGTVAGWGYNNKGVLSEDLKIIRMQLRNFGECRNNVGKGYTSYLTADKICATNKDDDTVEQGDGGGGLVVSKGQGAKEWYFIEGILSGREKGGNAYVLFTNVTSHIPWVNATLLTILKENNIRKHPTSL
ncbi:modular serine protease isoform X2 [Halyomorpha halys]|uniref:modular serine protease isoform X2 n=1 Tax=Halyomorpha halys TaxID=286706 RepID=UPI0006D51A08